MSQAVLLSAAKKLRDFNASKCNVMVGLDGFVDLIIDVVDKRTGPETYTRVETIGSLGERISRAAGLSSNLELVVRQEKLGGNGPIMANAMLETGCAVTYVGNLGRPAVHPVFADMAARCKACYSLAAPGTTDALEFRDGKVMVGKHQSLKEVNGVTVQALNVSKSFRDQLIRSRDLMFKMEATQAKIKTRTKSGVCRFELWSSMSSSPGLVTPETMTSYRTGFLFQGAP
jgi:hypothetical protein